MRRYCRFVHDGRGFGVGWGKRGHFMRIWENRERTFNLSMERQWLTGGRTVKTRATRNGRGRNSRITKFRMLMEESSSFCTPRSSPDSTPNIPRRPSTAKPAKPPTLEHPLHTQRPTLRPQKSSARHYMRKTGTAPCCW